MERFCHWADSLNEWTGRVVSVLVIPMALFGFAEVLLRYVFQQPTVWVWDVNTQLLAAMGALGGGYALLYGAHVGVDVFTAKLSGRKKAIVNLVTFPVFLLAMVVLLWKAMEESVYAVQIGEVMSTMFAPPIYPLKAVVTVGVALLIMQGTSKFIRDLVSVLSPRTGGAP